jgi:hypothetical protein
MASLWVHLNITPADAPSYPGSFRIAGSSGYDQTLTIAGHFAPNGGAIDIQFKKVPTTATYSLWYIGSDGEPELLVQNAPFQSLNDPSPPGS